MTVKRQSSDRQDVKRQSRDSLESMNALRINHCFINYLICIGHLVTMSVPLGKNEWPTMASMIELLPALWPPTATISGNREK